MKRSILPIICGLILAGGCATYTGIGSEAWYQGRLAEIEQSYNRGEISRAEYLALKNDVDKLRLEYLDEDYPYRPRGFMHGHRHHFRYHR